MNVNMGRLTSKRGSLHATVLRTRTLQEKILLTDQFRRQLLPLFANGLLRPIVDRVFPLEEVVAAHKYLASNANFGKIVLPLE